MRYTNTPKYGTMITKITHSALAYPPRSWLRKMSPNTTISNQNQMKNRKKYNIDRKTCPVPNSASVTLAPLRGVVPLLICDGCAVLHDVRHDQGQREEQQTEQEVADEAV